MPGERVVMVATSYPRFPGDTVGTFMEPIAHGIADRGHEVHIVLPWHPRWQRPAREGNVHFHLFRYAPVPALNVFGYAGALEADVRLRSAALVAAPLAAGAGWREAGAVAARIDATGMHGHWIVPGGVIAAAAAAARPLVISLHGSDVYVAERHRAVGRAARWAFRRAGFVTACSDDLRRRGIALGAAEARSATVPYGVDAGRFRPDSAARNTVRHEWRLPPGAEVVFAAGRFVRKKGFEHVIDAVARLAPSRPDLHLVLAGGGDLEHELRARISTAGLGTRVILPGVLPQAAVAAALAASDVAVVPSVRDAAGNVDGLPNVVLESLASGTPLVATPAGGIGAVVRQGETGVLVPEGDSEALATVLARLLDNPDERARLGATARAWTLRHAGWAQVAEAFERAYDVARAWRAREPHARS
jgi:glycosyltransferase involved in cell wall biosynthesis